MKKNEYKNNDVVATYCMCNFGGIEILDIIYDIDTYIIWRFNFGSDKVEKIHKSKVYYAADDRDYFKANGYKIFLNECIRTNIF